MSSRWALRPRDLLGSPPIFARTTAQLHDSAIRKCGNVLPDALTITGSSSRRSTVSSVVPFATHSGFCVHRRRRLRGAGRLGCSTILQITNRFMRGFQRCVHHPGRPRSSKVWGCRLCGNHFNHSQLIGRGQSQRRQSRPLSDCATRPTGKSWRAEVHAPALGRRRRSWPSIRAARSRSVRSTPSSGYPESVAARPRPPGPSGGLGPRRAQPNAQKGAGGLRRSAPGPNPRPPHAVPTSGARHQGPQCVRRGMTPRD